MVCFFSCQTYIFLIFLCFSWTCSMYSALWHLPGIILRAWTSQMFRENSTKQKKGFFCSFNTSLTCILHAQTTSDLYEAATLHLTWILVSDPSPFNCTYYRIFHLFLLKKTSCSSCSSLILKDMGMTQCVQLTRQAKVVSLLKPRRHHQLDPRTHFYLGEMFINC